MDARKTGMLICKKRKEQGLSQNDLAEKLHVSAKAISKWERGKSFPDISLLIPISETLKISLYDILTGGDDDEQK